MTFTHTHTQHAQYAYGSTHLAKVEHQVKLTVIAEELIGVDGLEITEVVVLEVQTEAEIQTSVSSVDSLAVTELVEQKRNGLSSLYVCTSSLDT